jgi:hypothetical protein
MRCALLRSLPRLAHRGKISTLRRSSVRSGGSVGPHRRLQRAPAAPRQDGGPASTETGSRVRLLTQMINRARPVKRRLAHQSPRQLVGCSGTEEASTSSRSRSLRLQRMVSTCDPISCRLHSCSQPRGTRGSSYTGVQHDSRDPKRLLVSLEYTSGRDVRAGRCRQNQRMARLLRSRHLNQAGLLAGWSSPERNHRVLAASPDLSNTGESVILVSRARSLHQGATLPRARRQVHNTGKNTQGNLNALLESRKNGQRFSPTHSRDPAAPLRSSALGFELY